MPCVVVDTVEAYPGEVTLGLLQDLGYDLRNLSNIWVDGAYIGEEVGSPGLPFNTVFEGVSAVYPGGNVYVNAGSYNESVALLKRFLRRKQVAPAMRSRLPKVYS